MSETEIPLEKLYIPDSPVPPMSPASEIEPQHPSCVKISEYESLRSAYQSGQVCYTRQLILRKLSRRSFLLSRMEFPKCYYLHNWVADILLMTELELLYWGNLLQNTGINDRHMRPRCILLLTGYLSKVGLSEEIEPYQNFLMSRFPNFNRDFEGWLLGTDCYAEFSIQEANLFLKLLLCNGKKKKNYEELVSSVLMRANHRNLFKSDDSTVEDQCDSKIIDQEYAFLPNILE